MTFEIGSEVARAFFRSETMDTAKVLVVGGYGEVGRRVSEGLVRSGEVRVVIAGRREEEATRFASELSEVAGGEEVSARHIDLGERPGFEAAIRDIDVVVMCVDAPDAHAALTTVQAGKGYVDISADDRLLTSIEALESRAIAAGGRALLSVGLAPGLTNLLGAEVMRRSGQNSEVSLWIELGMGDVHGEAAIGWMLDHLDTRFQVRGPDGWREVRSLESYRTLRWPEEPHPRRYYPFPFADQASLVRRSTARSVETRFRLSSGVITGALAWLSRMGGARALRHNALRQMAIGGLQSFARGTDRWRVAASAKAGTSSGDTTFVMGMEGAGESRATATVAVAAVKKLLSGDVAAGIWHLHQVMGLSSLVDALQGDDPNVRVSTWTL
ncbi:KR domain-containing protein [Lujinxingia sediminis]|uniref:KR domain-containing protein n=2 Tax=Lujinxingia sediminis TaxID=2480984 RepID=A0ABY0CW89_9DELT|nr:KR domain-containing protein [Lujinxingia sediminis]